MTSSSSSSASRASVTSDSLASRRAAICLGREYCSARKPACLDGPEACPLYDLCDRVGIDELDGAVVDPSDVVDG